MNGRDKVLAAFSQDGSQEVPVMLCYENIYLRDHWDQLTQHAWWYEFIPDLERQVQWRRDVIEKTGQDAYPVPFHYHYSREDRKHITIQERSEGVIRIDDRTGRRERLEKPHWTGASFEGLMPRQYEQLPETLEEVNACIPEFPRHDLGEITTSGINDLGIRFSMEFGNTLFPMSPVKTPLTHTFWVWGFEGMMIMIGTRPDLTEHAYKQLLDASIRSIRKSALLGAAGIWLEDCMADMISPEAYKRLNLPFIRSIVDEIRTAGMKSIHYFCGNPYGKLALIFDAGADALAFEESKKGFDIDIEDVVGWVAGRRTVFGNVDAIGILQDASEENLRAEVKRQIAAGHRNSGRFVMCTGSPVTPETPVERVHLFCDLTHEEGARK